MSKFTLPEKCPDITGLSIGEIGSLVASLYAAATKPVPEPNPVPKSLLKTKQLGTQIVVLDRGFVYVGKVEDAGENLVITNARCIRNWGTTKGLGELVNGPTYKTKLDDAGIVTAPKRAVIHLIQCAKDW